MTALSNDRGAAAVELAVVAPALMLLILGVLQLGLLYHGQNVLKTAAQEGARRAAAEGALPEEGETRVLEVVRSGLGNAAEDPTATIVLSSEVARAVVTAKMRGLLPIPGFSSLTLRAETSVFRERFRPEEEAP